MTRQLDVFTLRRFDWSRSDEELADALGKPVQLIKAWRGKAFGRRGRIDSPPPALVERWREQARTRTVTELATLWGLTPEGAHARLKRHGIESLGWSRGERRARPRASSETVDRWRREAAQHTADELARMWGVAPQTVYTRAARHGFTVRARDRGTPERVIERWRREAQGRTIAELARMWGVPRSTARGRVRRHDLPVKRSEAEPQPWAKPRRDVEEMRRDAEGRTVKELAALWGVSKQRAHQLVKKHALPARVRRRKPK